jgi:ABC-2 type transport system ATP-binding protein
MVQKQNDVSISIDKLSKRYHGSNRYALKDASLSVRQGEVYGFLGPNGAGKSTTIRLLLNFIQPTAGSATILGHDIVKDNVAILHSVGYLSGDFAIYPKMTGYQYLAYMSELLPPKSKKYMSSLIDRLKADPNKKLGELSRGNRQKFGIVQAFMHQPQVLILDEPTSGLDPLMQEVFYELIAEAKSRGAAIFMSSHILGEVQKTCDRVGIIRDGKIVDERNMQDMAKEASQTFDIVFARTPPVAHLKQVKGVKVQAVKENHVTIHMHGSLSALFAVLAQHDVLRIDARNLDLEDLFLSFYQDDREPNA